MSAFRYRGSALQRSRVSPTAARSLRAKYVSPSSVSMCRGSSARTRPCWESERSTWLTPPPPRRRVTPPISPASCSRVHRGHAASRSRASFSARVSCTEREDVSCSVGSGMAACTPEGYRALRFGLGLSLRKE